VVRNPGAAHAAIAPYGPFGCGDGEVVFLGIQNEREWKMFCEEVLGREGMAEDHRFDKNSRRVENRDELHAEIESVFSGLSSEEVIERLERAGVRTPGCAPCGSSSITPSWRRETAGVSSARR
jgi:crotonobetainyl-CoA:carnitine CoA-transferase CaiB-like acyl-CoA transferase